MKKIKPFNVAMLTISTMVLLLGGKCHKAKDPCKSGNIVRVPQHAVDFFYFKEGSWWVYEDEITKLEKKLDDQKNQIFIIQRKLKGSKFNIEGLIKKMQKVILCSISKCKTSYG